MFLYIDKPKGITSHDVVDRIRKITGEKKVGHGGTLDPMASGLLIVGVGRSATKKLSSISLNKDKSYLAQIFLGANSDTFDSEGVIEPVNPTFQPTKNDIEKVLDKVKKIKFLSPPIYSAIKISGKKAYELARQKKIQKLPKRPVRIKSIKLVNYKYPLIDIETLVSSGTYIRSIANKIGVELKTGAYLKILIRNKVGSIDLKDAVKLESLTKDNWVSHTHTY